MQNLMLNFHDHYKNPPKKGDKKKLTSEDQENRKKKKAEEAAEKKKLKDEEKAFKKRDKKEAKLEKKRRKVMIPKDEKLKVPKKSNNVLILNPKLHTKDSFLKKIFKILSDTFYEFAAITKVNGMYYLRRNVTSGWLRVLWSFIMIFLMSFAATLIYLLYRRYLDSPTRVTIASPMSIDTIPFPGITICHPQNVMEYKSREFVKKVKLPYGATPERVIEILPLLAGFVERQWAFPRKEDLEMIDKILDLNQMTVKQAIDELGTVCRDFLLVCSFGGVQFPCFQESKFMTFVESYSYLGACCSFNYKANSADVDINDELFHTDTFGFDGGLHVIGTGRPQASDGKSGAVYSEGFVALVHHTNDFAVESAPTSYLMLSRETFIDVHPIHSSCSDQVLGLPFAQRKCIIPEDLNVATYRQPECMLKCLRDNIHRRCGCHPFNLPQNANNSVSFPDCIAKDVTCFVENYFAFKTLKCNHCYPSCTDIFYKASSFAMPIVGINNSVNSIYTSINLTKEEFIVRVYFDGQKASANKKIVVTSWISLLSNLGGSFSLCLGISMLSFCEVIFFILFRLWHHYKRVFKVEPVIPKFNKTLGRY